MRNKFSYPHFRPKRRNHPDAKKAPWMGQLHYDILTDYLNARTGEELAKLANSKGELIPTSLYYSADQLGWLALAVLDERNDWLGAVLKAVEEEKRLLKKPARRKKKVVGRESCL